MNICCGVTLYFPTQEEMNNVKKLAEIFNKVYIFDNSDTSNVLVNNKEYLSNIYNVTYITQYRNCGLSIAYNIMCNEAIECGYDFICLLDQDSFISTSSVNEIINFIKDNQSVESLGICAPTIEYKGSSRGVVKNSKSEFSEINWTISSGSFINLKAFLKTGGFDENYFIDRLDQDYCHSVRKLGFKIIIFHDAILHQDLGQHKKMFFLNIYEHSPVRHYYIFRNRLYYYTKKNSPGLKNKIKLVLLNIRHLFYILLCESNKIRKINYLVIAYRDFMKGRMGKLEI